jgi:hypothetical protein
METRTIKSEGILFEFGPAKVSKTVYTPPRLLQFLDPVVLSAAETFEEKDKILLDTNYLYRLGGVA